MSSGPIEIDPAFINGDSIADHSHQQNSAELINNEDLIDGNDQIYEQCPDDEESQKAHPVNESGRRST